MRIIIENNCKIDEANRGLVQAWSNELTHKLRTMYASHVDYNFNNDHNWIRIWIVISHIVLYKEDNSADYHVSNSTILCLDRVDSHSVLARCVDRQTGRDSPKVRSRKPHQKHGASS